jgi:hypothetical protein
MAAAFAQDAPVPAPSREVPLSQSLSDPWQHRLLVELQRPVSLTVADADVLVLLGAISAQCQLAMTIDPGDAPLPKLSLDEHEVTLQALLDRIAVAAGLRYGLSCGALRWELAPNREQGAQPPWTLTDAPMEKRWYLVSRATGWDEEGVANAIDAIQRLPGWTDSEPSGIQQWNGSIVVIQPEAVHTLIERMFRRVENGSLPLREHRPTARERAIRLLLDDHERPPPGEAEHRLSGLLHRPCAIDLDARSIADLVARIAKLAGIRIVPSRDAGDLERPLPSHAIPLHGVVLEPRHALELALAGSGLTASMRVDGPAAWLELAPERTPRELVTRSYRIDYWDDPSALVDLMQRVEPEAWSRNGTSIEQLGGILQLDDGSEQTVVCANVTCTRETHAHLEERLAMIAAIAANVDESPREPELPALTVTVP